MATVLVDAAVVGSPMICFAPFAPSDFIEMSYDEVARLEQPRVSEFSEFSGAGELLQQPWVQ